MRLLTYQKLMTLDEEKLKNIKPSNIVIDEFHHVSAPKWGVGVKKLLDENPDAKVLGLTATPIRSDGINTIDTFFEGKDVSTLDLKDAFAQEILKVPYYFGAVYSYKEELEKAISHLENKKDLSDEKRKTANKLIREIKKHIEEGDGLKEIFNKGLEVSGKTSPKYIVFTRDIEDLNTKIKECKNWFDRNVEIYSIHSKQDEEKNIKEIYEFENSNSDKVKLLFSIDKLNEGLHISNVDGVIMLRPTQSNIVYSQQIGRALSLSGSEKTIIYDLVNNINGFYDSREFMTNMFASINNESIRENASIHIDFSIQAKMLYLFNELNTVIYSYVDRIEILKEYKEEFGSIENIRSDEIYKNYNIGSLVVRLRVAYKKGTLDDLQVKQLEELGMVWDKYVSIEKKLEILGEYAKEHNGIIADIKKIEIYKGYPIGQWIKIFRSGQQLTDEVKRKLNKLGMVWSKDKSIPVEKKLEVLIEYAKEHNGIIADIKLDEIYKGYPIGQWISDFRKGLQLTDETKGLLNKLGMAWSKNKIIPVEKKLEVLNEYAKEHNATIADIKRIEIYKGYPIGQWIKIFRSGQQLTDETKELLNKLGMAWSKDKSIPVEKKLEVLNEYAKEHNGIIADIKPNEIYKGYPIGVWINNFKIGRQLTDETKELLNKLGMKWAKKRK